MNTDTSVLLVEDDDDLREILALHLRARGYEVVEAREGHTALDRIHHGEPLSLVLLDLRMPGMSGLDVLQLLRAEGNDVPIVVLSGDRDAGGQALTAGARAFLRKPIEAAALLDAVRANAR
jgi:CheY-like chemotaxis protein